METSFVKFLRKTTKYFTYLFLFFLPWQAKLILRPGETTYSEISLYISHILLLLILFLFLWLRLKEKSRDDENHPLVYSLIALDVFIFISIFFASDQILAADRYFIILTGFSLFFIIRFGTAPRNYQDPLFNKLALIHSFLAGIFIQSVLGIYQFLTQTTFAYKFLGIAAHNPATLGTAVIETANGRWLRAYGGLDHPNILGGVITISLIFYAYFLARKKILSTKKQIWSSVFLFVSYFISLYALFFTFSRSAWLALLVGFAVLLLIFIINKDKWILGRFNALMFFSAVLISIVILPYRELLMVRLDMQTRLEQKSITERQAYLIQAREILQKKFLTGVGVGNYSVAVALADNNKKPAWDYQPVHNTFLLLWTESGLFAFLSFLAFLFFLIKSGRRETFAWAILAPIIILMLLDHWLISLPFGVLFLFLIFGLI